MIDLSAVLKLYAKYRKYVLSSFAPAKMQERQLFFLLRKAADTKIGRDHDFRSIKSVSEFQRRVPVRSYEQIWEDYFKPSFPHLNNCTWPGLIKTFAVSSGTTSGATKYIPISPEMVRSNTKAGLDLLSYHVLNKPNSKILGGKSLIVSGSTIFQEYAPGIGGGDLSGIAMMTMPSWARTRTFPTYEMTQASTWEERLGSYASGALQQDIRSINGAPSWMLLLLDRIKLLKPEAEGKLSKIFPQLEMLVHGGMSFAPYRKLYMEYLEGGAAETREVYPASEGFIAVQDRGYDEGMRLILDHGIFFEFIPLTELGSLNPVRHWVKNIERGVDYAVVMSSCAGMWSYLIGDTVRFIDTEPPRLLMTGRTSYMLSAVGEHLIGREIDDALQEACDVTGLDISEYSVGALFPTTSDQLVTHIYVIEFTNTQGLRDLVQSLQDFAQTLDQSLIRRNEDYEAHRRKNFGLNPPKIIVAPPGTFHSWMRKRGKFGGQNKVPRVINDQELFKSLLTMIA